VAGGVGVGRTYASQVIERRRDGFAAVIETLDPFEVSVTWDRLDEGVD
jgi:hypothetical protein